MEEQLLAELKFELSTHHERLLRTCLAAADPDGGESEDPQWRERPAAAAHADGFLLVTPHGPPYDTRTCETR